MQTTVALGPSAAELEATLAALASDRFLARLWQGDATLWTGADEGNWLGWLRLPDAIDAFRTAVAPLVEEVRADGLTHVVLLGMGGSSLAPEVIARTLGAAPGHPELVVLDSTVPTAIAAVESTIEPTRTLFVVASKSGTTAEPNALYRHFRARVEASVSARAGRHFVAITDPGSPLQRLADDAGFRATVPGEPSVGGRFSALSAFGLLPAALLGVDLERLLQPIRTMVAAHAADADPAAAPAVRLGAALGVLARAGRDKLTLSAAPPLAALGPWLEQLVAESTGKAGRGIVPIDGETLGSPASYGDDRVFVDLTVPGEADSDRTRALDALAAAGHPLIRISTADPIELGAEFFRWEIATAVAAAVLGINPFDQPDVEAAKVRARELIQRFEEEGELPARRPIAEDDTLALYAAEAAPAGGVAAALAAHVARLGEGDYLAINAFVAMNPVIEAELDSLRHALRARHRIATALGFGPRYLHSTGQLHKGGPGSGLFLVLTADAAVDFEVPGQKLSFGVLSQAQARGDHEALVSRDRRTMHVHLRGDTIDALRRLRELLEQTGD